MLLTLPGKVLDLTKLNKDKKFSLRGKIDGGLQAMRNLEQHGFGKLLVKTSKGSVKVSYDVPNIHTSIFTFTYAKKHL